MPITDIFLEPSSEDRQDRVMTYHIDFDQRIDDRTGRPIGRPVLTQFAIRIRRDSEEGAPFYVNWMTEPTQQESLKISFYDDNKLVRFINIENAFLVSYNQDCSDAGSIEETLIVSPQRTEIDGVSFERNGNA